MKAPDRRPRKNWTLNVRYAPEALLLGACEDDTENPCGAQQSSNSPLGQNQTCYAPL